MLMAKRRTRTSKSPRRRSVIRGPSAGPKVRVRMYRQGLGDCFLLTFGSDGTTARHMLIDCGTLGASTTPQNTIKRIAAHITETTGGANSHLTILVATHEHKDHLSGFNSQPQAFQNMKPDHVWLAWTEDPQDELAKQISIYKGDLALALGAAIRAAPANGAKDKDNPPAALAANAARDILDFAGDPQALGATNFAETIDKAMKFVRDDLGVRPTYHLPGADPLEVPEIPGFRFYTLGPPRSLDKLSDMGKHGSEHLYGLLAAARVHAAASRGKKLPRAIVEKCEAEMPFDTRYRLVGGHLSQRHFPQYAREKWRRVDNEWLHVTSELALQLDSLTNNTSLALAIERIADGRVLLFPADAQQGSWLSWHDPSMKWTVKDGNGVSQTITAADLLARTVFYKVGHHSSHNATARAEGLELMTRTNELVAFIPVDRKVALSRNPKGSWKMPARPLYRRLLDKCQGRVVRSDVGWADDSRNAIDRDTEEEFDGMAPANVWAKWAKAQGSCNVKVDESGLFIDYTLE